MNGFIVGIGGILGALARYGLGLAFGAPDPFPIATLITNLLGCLVLGWLLEAWRLKWPNRLWIKNGFGTGVIGAFTTFSTLSVETVHLIQDQHVMLAALYVIVSVAGGLLLVSIGRGVAQKMFATVEMRQGELRS
ncbi:fluoride efflux transporter CrcB [Gorillibacterium massiliense]|uniref:fluoride efflux transporter CrcB n=1 Tax=Gorillibacterium massiliense TaxID=1280390 RepID=UPI0004BCD573|nr:fluoride efflux transporter CrcB [Gorillibacterium massiliense]